MRLLSLAGSDELLHLLHSLLMLLLFQFAARLCEFQFSFELFFVLSLRLKLLLQRLELLLELACVLLHFFESLNLWVEA